MTYIQDYNSIVIGICVLAIGIFIIALISGFFSIQPTEHSSECKECNIETDVNQYNFQVMRDLFTPMYNDTVTVENAEYNNGYCFWVNHTRELKSYYFSNAHSYLVLFNRTTDRLELLKSIKYSFPCAEC